MNITYSDVAKKFREIAGAGLKASPASTEELAIAESDLNIAFPESFRRFQLEFGDYGWPDIEIWSVCKPSSSERNIVGVYNWYRGGGDMDSGIRSLPSHLIPFADSYTIDAPDAYCFDTSNKIEGEFSIVFWPSSLQGDDAPKLVANNFLEWLNNELNDWDPSKI